MNLYAWSTVVVSTLTTSIHSSLESPENVTGCVLLLLVNHNELKPISREEMELICNDDEEDTLGIEEHLETEEDEDHVAEALADDQPLKDFIDLGKLEQVQKENKRLKSENMALVEELNKMRETIQKIQEDQEAKTKEMMEKMSSTEKKMEKLRKEIEVLEFENKQLVEQNKKNAVHAAT
ncbi:unnamed protein product [Camellia sinensis]